MLEHSEIRVFLPRIRIIKLTERIGYIPDDDARMLKDKLDEVDRAICQLLHAKSVIERVLYKAAI